MDRGVDDALARQAFAVTGAHSLRAAVEASALSDESAFVGLGADDVANLVLTGFGDLTVVVKLRSFGHDAQGVTRVRDLALWGRFPDRSWKVNGSVFRFEDVRSVHAVRAGSLAEVLPIFLPGGTA